MNYEIFFDKFEEEDKRKTLQVCLEGQSIYFSSHFSKMKFEFN